MPQKRPIEKIHAAAYLFFTLSRDGSRDFKNIYQEIADAFEISPSAVRKWTKTDEWNSALKAFGGEFEKQPTRDTARERSEELENARKIYLELLAKGEPPHRLSRLVSEITGIKKRTIAEWAKRYNWRGDAE